MDIKASLVKELRDLTGAGMMDCRRALEDTKGNIEEAIDTLRKKGAAKAVQKAGRIAAEGLIVIKLSDDQKSALMLEINCETDFVARDENFVGFANHVAEIALANKVKTVDNLGSLPYQKNQAETIEQTRQALVAKVGENVNIRRVTYMQSETKIGSYNHGSRIGVIVSGAGGDDQLFKDLAMHIAANHPLVIAPEQVPQENIDREREIFSAQAKESGKPAEIVEKMVNGRINKYLDEVSLLGQPFVKDPETKVAKLLQNKQASVSEFIRFAVGEGIDKPVTNFAEEVMEQVRQS